MTANELVEHIALSTPATFDKAERLVGRGLSMGISIDDMAEFAEPLDDLILLLDCYRYGVTVAQARRRRDDLRVLLFGLQYRLVDLTKV